VYIGKRAIAVLPDKCIDLGDVADDEAILYRQKGPELEVLKVKRHH
jgi:hypothetical protein